MTNAEMNKLAMYRAARAVLNTFADTLQTIPALKKGSDSFSTAVDILENIHTEHKTVSKGTVAEKHDVKSHLAREADTICGTLYAYGKKIGDSHLTEIMNVTESELGRLRDNMLLEEVKNISKTFSSLQPNLGDYAVTNESVTAFQKIVTDFDKSLNNKDSKGTTSVAAREKLSKEFAAIDKILQDEIDKLIKLVRNTNSDCYNQYLQARVIKDYGIRHLPDDRPPVTPVAP